MAVLVDLLTERYINLLVWVQVVWIPKGFPFIKETGKFILKVPDSSPKPPGPKTPIYHKLNTLARKTNSSHQKWWHPKIIIEICQGPSCSDKRCECELWREYRSSMSWISGQETQFWANYQQNYLGNLKPKTLLERSPVNHQAYPKSFLENYPIIPKPTLLRAFWEDTSSS